MLSCVSCRQLCTNCSSSTVPMLAKAQPPFALSPSAFAASAAVAPPLTRLGSFCCANHQPSAAKSATITRPSSASRITLPLPFLLAGLAVGVGVGVGCAVCARSELGSTTSSNSNSNSGVATGSACACGSGAGVTCSSGVGAGAAVDTATGSGVAKAPPETTALLLPAAVLGYTSSAIFRVQVLSWLASWAHRDIL